ncbi:LPS-assembly protein LptD [Rosistilla oblonga]|uniref:LPS-assembly protein LptD n=1 Tax=Rosistilla oblonga TaxID=2527990 RepID=A0A518IVN4_9BACT|nr:LPS-assembly protein LptD [Rosistilla oblonga]
MNLGTDARQKRAPRRYDESGLKIIQTAARLACALALSLFATVCVGVEIELPPVDPADRIMIRGDEMSRWTEGQYDVLYFKGNCQIAQNGRQATGGQMMLWVDQQGPDSEIPTKVIAYLEDGVEVQFGFNISNQKLRDQNWLGRFYSRLTPDVTALEKRGEPEHKPAILDRMRVAHGQGDRFPIQQVQFELPPGGGAPSATQPQTAPQLPPQLPTAPPNLQAPPNQPVPQNPPAQNLPPQNVPLQNLPPQNPPPQNNLPPPNLTVPPNGGSPPGLVPDLPPPPMITGNVAPPQQGAMGTGGLNFSIGAQAVEITSRGSTTPTQIQTINRPNTGETVVVASQGVTVVIRDVQAQMAGGGSFDLGAITISADRVVAWLPLLQNLEMFGGSQPTTGIDGELYLEGDIVFRQGERIIYAKRMYYNIARQQGVVLAAEVIATTPQYDGLVRLKADVLRQVGQGDFIANGAAVTTSRLGTPTYWLQSGEVRFTDREQTAVNPYSGEATVVDRDMRATSRNNFVYVGGFPLLYWPVFATNLQNPSYYLTGAKVKNDSIFGTQVFLDFDAYQLFGIDSPIEGTDWELSADYLSDRGPAGGTHFDYSRPDLLGVGGPANGFVDAWGIVDSGLDTLGSDRRDMTPAQKERGRVLWRHRQYFANDWEVTMEAGLISDRNFLEQYLEQEWDRDKDHTTGAHLRKYYDNQLFDFSAKVRVNEFFTDNNELPRFDHYLLGSSLLGDHFTWSAHTSVGYSKLEVDEVPSDPTDAAKFTLFAWERDREGLRASSRQELAMPLQLGVVKAVPFVSGEAAYWGEALDGEDLTRFLGQAGIRGSLPMWRLSPQVQSSLLNIQGLAHKVEVQGEFFFAEADQNLDELPMYDQMDDNAQEQFRRRFLFNTFGLSAGDPLPIAFDPRYYAVRMGLQRNVTSPTTEMADDLMQGRIGLHQNWQTKRGLPGRERIVDLAQFDVDLFVYPDGDRDNLGEVAGPLTYDFRYHAGDRVTLLSDGYFDFFADGLKSVSAGILTSRPGLGNIYAGILSLEGPISSNVLQGAIDYRLSEKWIMSANTTFDLGEVGNVGQELGITRIGESALIQVGVNVDSGRDNVSFNFRIEPRFLPNRKLGRLGGQLIPPPGAEGLE